MGGWKMRAWAWCAVLLVTASGLGCNPAQESGEAPGAGQEASPAPESAPPAAEGPFPAEHIRVQHVLIEFRGSVPGKDITRSRAEAEQLAGQIAERARGGEEFGQLVREYTDDAYPGIYGLANTGVTPNAPNEFERGGMVKGFGDTAFSLRVGEVGVAAYDAQASPYGWHVIKRIE